jgi:hypothetical protein
MVLLLASLLYNLCRFARQTLPGCVGSRAPHLPSIVSLNTNKSLVFVHNVCVCVCLCVCVYLSHALAHIWDRVSMRVSISTPSIYSCQRDALSAYVYVM